MFKPLWCFAFKLTIIDVVSSLVLSWTSSGGRVDKNLWGENAMANLQVWSAWTPHRASCPPEKKIKVIPRPKNILFSQKIVSSVCVLRIALYLGGTLVGSILQANHALASFQYLRHQHEFSVSLLLHMKITRKGRWEKIETSSSNWRLFSVACFTPNTGPSQPFFWVWNIVSIKNCP